MINHKALVMIVARLEERFRARLTQLDTVCAILLGLLHLKERL